MDLLIGGYFFATRPCEIVLTNKVSKTKTLAIGDLVFRTKAKTKITKPSLAAMESAEFVSVTFRDQKNGNRFDTRTQRRTADPSLCPVRRFLRVVLRIRKFVPHSTANTLLCTLFDDRSQHDYQLSDTFTLQLLRSCCTRFGGTQTFGFDQSQIGNRSLRSGAAMSLFMNNHSPSKIMILGRWSSDAFLIYIRPQVLEWTNNMSSDMINFESFLDVGFYDTPNKIQSTQRQKFLPLNGRGSIITLPSFNLDD